MDRNGGMELFLPPFLQPVDRGDSEMDEIKQNQLAWSQLTQEHYQTFLKAFQDGTYRFSQKIEEELGELRGQKILHLQCNTGADTIYLAQLGASQVTGVDLVPENIQAACRMAQKLGVSNTRFFVSDIMELTKRHHEQYDLIFVSEGALIWIPDKEKWAQIVSSLLNPEGELYLNDAHPFFLIFDEEKFSKGELKVRYPYFETEPVVETGLGGYAGKVHAVEHYTWMYTVGMLFECLTKAGMTIEYFHEIDGYMCDIGGMEREKDGLFYSKKFRGKLPMTFSLRARKNSR